MRKSFTLNLIFFSMWFSVCYLTSGKETQFYDFLMRLFFSIFDRIRVDFHDETSVYSVVGGLNQCMEMGT
jgi:hypothetical protein